MFVLYSRKYYTSLKKYHTFLLYCTAVSTTPIYTNISRAFYNILSGLGTICSYWNVKSIDNFERRTTGGRGEGLQGGSKGEWRPEDTWKEKGTCRMKKRKGRKEKMRKGMR
jgi:hypothetical protein